MPHHSSDAENVTKKMTFDEAPFTEPAVSSSCTSPLGTRRTAPQRTPVTNGGPFSSLSPRPLPIVLRVRSDDFVEDPASPKLKLSEPSDTPMMSADMSVECVLKPFQRERVANWLSDLVLSKIPRETCDDQFWEVAGLDQSAREGVHTTC